MRKLFTYFQQMSKEENFIAFSEIIESATVPLIKLEIDLQVIQELTRRKTIQAKDENDDNYQEEPFVLINNSMVMLHVDITFDDYNASMG